VEFLSRCFLYQIEHFSKNYRVIAIDPRSQGYSTKTTEGNNYTVHGRDLANLINKLQLDNIILAGWSFGNLDTWEYVKQNGLKKIQAVIMIDNKPRSITDGKLGSLDKQVNNNLDSQEHYRQFMKAFAENKLLTRKIASSEELNLLAGESLQMPYDAARDLYVSGKFGNCEEIVKEISKKKPSLLILSTDRVEPTRTWFKTNAAKTDIEVLGKHMMFWEFPNQFNKFLEEFFQKNDIH
jgi:non-heme chloroperoxidase